MLRSISISPEKLDTEAVALRRNLTRDSLEEAVRCKEIVWIDISDPDQAELTWLQDFLTLHPIVTADLKRKDRRPTLLVYPDYLFLSMFQARLRMDRIEGEEIHFVIGATWLVTVRDSTSDALDKAYELIAQNPTYARLGVIYFLYVAIQSIIDSYYPLLDKISLRLNEIEGVILANGRRFERPSIYRIKQQLVSLRQMVAPQREVLSNMLGEKRIAQENAETRDLFRHLYERLLRVSDAVDGQRELWSNVLDLMENIESAKMTSAVNRLTILSMIFLPLTFLVGLLGLNFVTTQPEFLIPLPGNLVVLMVLLVAVGMGLALAAHFKRRGWL